MAHLKRDFKKDVYGGVIGHAVGDALGVPVEFVNRITLDRNPVDRMTGYGTHHMPPGTWSDDTSMSIALMQSIIDCSGIDYDDIMRKFLEWSQYSRFTATGETFDIGGTCAISISNYIGGTDPLDCGETGERSNGNGSLMRILPIAYACYGRSLKDEKKYQLVSDVSSLTHAHEISILGCYIYVNFVCHLLAGDKPIEAYNKTCKDDYSRFSEEVRAAYLRILAGEMTKLDKDDISSKGYAISTLEAALWCLLTTKSYKDAVLKAVNLGGDTDTIGAVTGSMAGIFYGYNAIPKEWLNELKKHEYLLRLCNGFAGTVKKT